MIQPIQLGPYRIDRQIGKGGMGSVYEGIDLETGQRAAIKALSPHLAQAEGFRERFEAEIESLKTLCHDSIVRLYGFGEENGVLFYSMELIAGSSLEDELKAGRRFNWREVTDIAIQLCGALKHAHDHGIIHRDIKPANILFADDRHVKLADFGIARLFGITSSLTMAGGVLGTADYMSPEQADGRPITARCDQYSLGGVMYALLAGRPPFRAKGLPEMLQLQRFAQPEPVSRYAPDTPKQLEGLIAQLLAKDPADRFPNCGVLTRHLQAMVMALSRPMPDGIALAGELGEGHVSTDLSNSLAIAMTRAESQLPAALVPPKTLRDDPSAIEEAIRQAPMTDDETMAADEPQEPSFDNSLSKSTQVVRPKQNPPAGTSVFTTVEEDLARRKQLHRRSWTSAIGPLASLVIALAALGALGVYLSRPMTADELYERISRTADPDDAEAIRRVEREINDFVKRFPDDDRNVELREHQTRLELDRMHRQLLRHRGGIADASLLPVEVVYLEAIDTATTQPEVALRKLEALVSLYGPATTRKIDPKDRQALCVQLAERQITQLSHAVRELAARQLAALRDRMKSAQKIALSDPQGARRIYSALIELYGNQPWAADVVAEAREKMSELPKP